MGLETCVSEILELSQKGNSVEEQKARKMKELQERIKKGESTGDPIKDFLVVCYGSLKLDPVENNLKRLKEEISSHQNQQVLVIEKHEKHEGCTGFGSLGYYGLDEKIRLGNLSGELSFDLNNSSILIPTEKYAETTKRAEEEWKVCNEQIIIPGFDFVSLDRGLPCREIMEEFKGHESLASSLRILTGDRDVELYFRFPEHHFWNFLKEIKEGKIDNQKLDVLLKEFGHLDTTYNQALKLLGLEDKIPADFRKKGRAKQRAQRTEAIKQIEGYITQKELVKKVVSTIRKQQYLVTDAMLRGSALAEEELRVLNESIGYRRVGRENIPDLEATCENLGVKTKGIREQIRNVLTKALDLGMHERAMPLDLKRPGLNIPEYITALCKEYDVKIP